MKKIALVIVTLMLTVISISNAQTSKAYFESAKTKQKLNEATVAYTFQVDNITTDQQRQLFENKFKEMQSVLSVKSSLMAAGGRAAYTVSVTKQRNKEIVQRMLISAGINTVNVDGKDIETAKAVEYANAQKKQQAAK
jgi:hypothetical protein